MALVLVLAAGLWFFGRFIGAPVTARFQMIALLYVAVLAVNVALPPGHPLREATGGSAGEWVVLGVLGAAVWAYSVGLNRLRTRVRPENLPSDRDAASAPSRLGRAARHIALREIGGMGQQRIEAARVLVVGAGGLGSPVLQYLAAAGVGTIGIVDDDVVDRSNLHRQVIHQDADVGRPKVVSVGEFVEALNPDVTVETYQMRLGPDNVESLIADYDIVVDCSD